MFDLRNNVPPVYVNESRDFQLMCVLFNLVQNSTKFEIDSMLNILDIDDCSDALLPFLQSKLGFIVPKNSTYTSDEIRSVLKGFIDVVRHKGSRVGIKKAVDTYLNSQHIPTTSSIDVVHDVINSEFKLQVYIERSVSSTKLLDDLLRYVIPTGYTVTYEFVKSTAHESTVEQSSDVYYNSTAYNSYIYFDDSEGSNPQYPDSKVGTATVKGEKVIDNESN